MALDHSKLVVPRHIAIVMDGNGRWAKKRNLPVYFGHSKGAENVDKIVDYMREIGVEYLTLFAFSTENWNRVEGEVRHLMTLFKKKLKKVIEDRNQDIKINIIGRKSKISKDLANLINEVETMPKKNVRLTLNVAIDYGSREEIVSASRQILHDFLDKKISIEDLNEDFFANYLYTKDSPDVDLFIRTAGEMRLSNFLLWQSSYAEFVSTKTLWPDFSEADVDSAIEEFNRRNRTFGRRD